MKSSLGADVLFVFRSLFLTSFVIAAEFVRLADLPFLEDLVFVGNPLEEKYSADQQSSWVEEATKRVPRLKKLDGEL